MLSKIYKLRFKLPHEISYGLATSQQKSHNLFSKKEKGKWYYKTEREEEQEVKGRERASTFGILFSFPSSPPFPRTGTWSKYFILGF